MVQTVKSVLVHPGGKEVILEKPHTLHRVFFSVRVITGAAYWYDSRMSFDDPLFLSFYTLDGPEKYFEANGPDIFQGSIWVLNNSASNLVYTASEILH